mgnify:CR=1 FL=1
MRTRIGMKKAAVIGIAGVMLFTWGISSVSASIVSTEKPMAGMNVQLDRFVVAEVETGVVRSITGITAEQNTADDTTDDTTDVAEQPTEQEPVQDDLKEEKDEHVKLNLNYDRLGIAKVDTYLNVRAKASTGSKVVGKLTKNAGCHIYSIKKGWAKIVSGDVKGYVKAQYLVKDEEAEQMALEVGTKVVTVKENGLRVRALPSTDSSIYSVLSYDEDFEVYREKLNAEWLEKFIAKNVKKREVKKVNYDEMANSLADWVCISVDNDYAFVSKEYVEISYKLKRAVKVGQLATDGSDGVSSTRASVVEYAKNFLGNRYVYGGTSLTNGTDCSGFTMGVFSHFGYGLPRTSGSQAASTSSIKSSEAKPGDLFFYGSGGHVNHVAIYIGGGMIIHASNPSSGIKISNAYYRQPIKVGRVIKD